MALSSKQSDSLNRLVYQAQDLKGTVGPCAIHTDVTFRSPNVYLDGVLMCEIAN